MKQTIFIVMGLFLVILLFACSSTTDAGTEEHIVEFKETNILYSDGYGEHALYINPETKCMYTNQKWFIPIADQQYGSNSGNCTGPYQYMYEEMSK